MEMYKLAKNIATEAHEGQFRRDGKTPYIVHPEEVASHFNINSIEACVAWLHDVVEDTDVTLERLRVIFLEEIVSAVDVLTKKPTDNYLQYILEIFPNKIAKKVKLIDMKCNMIGATKNQKEKYILASFILNDRVL